MMEGFLLWHQARPRLAVFVHAPICLALLSAALIAQYGFGLTPCELCLWQRVPYAVIAVIAFAALLKDRKWTPWVLGLIAVFYLIETGIALHHLGVEQDWWNSAAGCGFQATGQDIKEMYERIVTAPAVACDQPEWFFLGVSMAGWNAVIAALLAVFTAAQIRVQLPWWTARKSG
jgi:disulfide bond formation protein DsbB